MPAPWCTNCCSPLDAVKSNHRCPHHHDTCTIHLTDTRTIRGHAIGTYGRVVGILYMYMQDTCTILDSKDDTSCSIHVRLRYMYWSEICTIHIQIQNTIHFLRYISDTYTIHERYKNHRNRLCIQSSIHTAQPLPKPRFRIECVSKCIENAFATRAYTFDTRTIRTVAHDTERYKLWGKATTIHGETGP